MEDDHAHARRGLSGDTAARLALHGRECTRQIPGGAGCQARMDAGCREDVRVGRRQDRCHRAASGQAGHKDVRRVCAGYSTSALCSAARAFMRVPRAKSPDESRLDGGAGVRAPSAVRDSMGASASSGAGRRNNSGSERAAPQFSVGKARLVTGLRMGQSNSLWRRAGPSLERPHEGVGSLEAEQERYLRAG